MKRLLSLALLVFACLALGGLFVAYNRSESSQRCAGNIWWCGWPSFAAARAVARKWSSRRMSRRTKR